MSLPLSPGLMPIRIYRVSDGWIIAVWNWRGAWMEWLLCDGVITRI